MFLTSHDEVHRYFMNDRIYQDGDNRWYFHVRGNQIVGPFASFEQAERGLLKHVSACRTRTTSRFRWPRIMLPGRLWRGASTTQR